MSPEELGRTLSKMYRDAPEGEATTMIHLFGIRYANEICGCGASVAEIIRLSDLSESYNTEVSKGVRLARYVECKSGIANTINPCRPLTRSTAVKQFGKFLVMRFLGYAVLRATSEGLAHSRTNTPILKSLRKFF